MNIKCILIFVLLEFGHFLSAQLLDVHISNIRNTKGQLCLAIFASEDEFKVEKPCWRLYCDKKEVHNGEFSIQIPFREGNWGFSLLDDENSNGKMEYNFIGMPREGFGFSNYELKGLHRPVFDDFCFQLKKDEKKVLLVKVKYY